MTALVVVSKAFGFLRLWVVAAALGLPLAAGAFYLVEKVVMFFAACVVSSLQATFLTLYTDTRTRRGEDAARRFATGVLTALAGALAAVVIAAELAPERVLYLVSDPARWSAPLAALAVALARWLFPLTLLLAVNEFLKSLLYAAGRAPLAVLSPIVNTACVLAWVWAGFARFGPHAIAYGMLSGAALQGLVLAAGAWRSGFRLRRPWGGRGPGASGQGPAEEDGRGALLRALGACNAPLHPQPPPRGPLATMLRLAFWTLLTRSIVQVNGLVDARMASRPDLPEEAIAALSVAQQFLFPFYQVITLVLTGVSLHYLAQFHARGEHDRLRRLVNDYALAFAFLFVPLTCWVAAAAPEIVGLLFGWQPRASFTARGLALVTDCYAAYGLGLWFTAMTGLFAACYLALQKTHYSTISGIVMVGANLVLNFVLLGPLGVPGLALATSGVMALAMTLQYLLVARDLPGLVQWGRLARRVAPLAAFSVAGAALCRWAAPWWRAWWGAEGLPARLGPLGAQALAFALVLAIAWRLCYPRLWRELRAALRGGKG